ncbi:MAG: BlaI/MecI/CopY family transcriptional regulator [Thermoguttaceae bacterium]
MEKHELNLLGEQQRRMLEILWEKDGATVQEVLDEINSNSETQLAYTTVLATMQKLEKLGWLVHEPSENRSRTYVYKVTRSRGEAIGASLVTFAKKFLGGNKMLLFQHFVDDAGLNEKEISEIKQMLEERKESK